MSYRSFFFLGLKKGYKNLVKLSKYAEILGIKDEVMNYMEAFYE